MTLYQDFARSVADFAGDSGMCPDDARLIEHINEARRILYPLGDWKDTVQAFRIKSYCGTIVLPHRFDRIIQVKTCSSSVINNDWFNPTAEKVQGGVTEFQRHPSPYCYFRGFPIVPVPEGCAQPGFWIEVQSEAVEDNGVELKFICDGVNQTTLSVTRELLTPYTPVLAGVGEPPILNIRHVIKPQTKGRIRLYGYDGANRVLMGLYDPDDVNPSYAAYSSFANCSLNKAHSGSYCYLVNLKKKYIPLNGVNDEVMDFPEDAIIHALQAINERRSRNLNGYNANMKMAVDFLNAELSGPANSAMYPMKISPRWKVEGLIE